MALTGFDPSVVNQSIGAVKNAYNELINVLGDQVQNQFVDGMADKWACNNAQTFFANFKSVLDSLITDSNTVFESVVSSMSSAAAAWASDTNTEYSTTSLEVISKTINVEGIQENIAGVRGVDVDTATTTAGTLTTISANAESALSNAEQAVQQCGFIGGEQASNLIASLGKIKANISNAFTELSTSAKSGIEQTVSQYSDTAGKIAAAFAGQE